MSHFVVDASVGVKWLLSEIHDVAARRLLDAGYRLHVPDLFYAEIGNTLWKRVRRREMTTDEALASFEALDSVAVEVAGSRTLTRAAVQIACQLDRSAYDSLYLALAVRERCRLVTADEKLYNALRAGPIAAHLCWVEDVPAVRKTRGSSPEG